MNKQLLHTPEGVRDIYGDEFKKKLKIENTFLDKLHLYGYEDIQTPTFEFFDVFSKKIGTIPSKELYKFFDKEGNTLVLRPDITPSIARANAKYFMEDNIPRRFCYCGNTFINASDLQGRLKETTQIGAELIGDYSVEADAEMIMLMIECMKSAGIKDFQVSIGNLEFFKGLCDEYGIPSDAELELREMISNKNYFGIQDILDSLSLSEDKKDTISIISELFGSIEMLSSFKNSVINDRSLKAIERLEELHALLKANNADSYVTYDLGMLSKYHYYTGVIFRAYTYGSGDAVIKGGRYDSLLTEFGKDTAAIGFAIIVDKILNALSVQNINPSVEHNTCLYVYSKNNAHKAKELADNKRKSGIPAIMMLLEEDKEAMYEKYAKENNYELYMLK